jgi:hypothetical protein
LLNFRKDIGLTYTRYSAVASAALRQCLKSETGAGARKADVAPLKITPWEAGKAKKAE